MLSPTPSQKTFREVVGVLTVARLLRESKGISQKEAAVQVGLTIPLLCMFERGKTVLPRKWEKPLASFYGVKVYELVNEEGFAHEAVFSRKDAA